MTTKVLSVTLAIMLTGTLGVQATTVLPDSCGADNVKFKVTRQKNQPALSGPTAGEAQVVIIENPDMDPKCFGPSCHVTVRIGMDGKWMGATEEKSYSAFSVAPGEHHLCANWQSALGSLNKLVDMTSFTAEAGRVYYFEVKPVMQPIGEHEQDEYNLHLKSLSEDEGKYGVKVSPRSTPTAKP